MTILEIGGKQVEVDSSFMNLSKEDQQKTVDDIASKIGAGSSGGTAATTEPEDTSSRAVGVSFLRGIPLAGAYADKAAAALNAAAQPITETGLSHAPTFSQRYAENLPRITRGTDRFQREHPVESTVDELLGGTAALAPLGASAPVARAIGLSGSLPSMVARGALSNAAIGAADEALRGGSATHGAEVGAVTGAAFPLAGRAIGKGVQALRNIRGEPMRTGLPTEEVAGQPINQLPNDNLSSSQAQAALSGALGPDAQRIAQQGFEQRAQQAEQARQNIGAQMSPATDPRMQPPGAAPAEQPSPYQAGDQAITELARQHNDQIQADALRGIAGQAEEHLSRAGIAPGMPQTSREAMESLGEGLRTGAAEAANARTARYNEAGATEGQFSPAGFERISNSLEQRLNSGAPEQRVRVNDLTPRTREALQLIENEIGTGRRPTNAVDARTTNYNSALNEGVQMRPAPPITGRDIESVRQQLVPLVRDANNAARAPGGSYADARGMRRLMEAFDQHVRDVVRAGGFSGDGEELLRRYEAARQAHGAYRQTFSNRGQGDIVGPVIESVLGKHPGQQMTPETLAQSLYGSESGTGGNKQTALAQRIMGMFGHESDIGQNVKQGLLSHVLDQPGAPLPLEKQSERIRQLVSGKGNSLSQVIFTPEERQRLLGHADLLDRLATPGRAPNATDLQLRKLSGVDGGVPASGRQAIEALMNDGGKPKPNADALASRLKELLSPESYDSLRQGIWQHLTTAPEHTLDWGPQKISQRLGAFLNDPLAKQLYSTKELQLMEIMQREYQKMIPAPNTTNPSGSGIFATKMVRAAQSSLLPLLGLATHGPTGVMAGIAANKVLQFVGNRRAVNQTKNLFMGKKVETPSNPNFERAAAILSHAAMPLSAPAGQ